MMLSTRSMLALSSLASLTLLTACDSSTGGAAGDVDGDNLATIELLAPFTGSYDLQDDWRTLDGIDVDQAFLLIETPGTDGTAPVQFLDYDDFGNCLPSSSVSGILRKDDFSDDIFLDGLPDFEEAALSLSGSTLTIEFNDSDLDLDNDGDTFDRVSITAEQLGMEQVDLGPDC